MTMRTGQAWVPTPSADLPTVEKMFELLADNVLGEITAQDHRDVLDYVLSSMALIHGGAPDWDATKEYKTSDFVWDKDQLYRANADHPASPVRPSDASATGWEKVSSKGGVTYVNRVGDLPDPATASLEDGQIFVIRQSNGSDLYQIAVWDANLVNTPVGGTGVAPLGGWRFLVPHIFSKALRSDPDTVSGQKTGDLQVTVEPQHIEVKMWQNSAWQTILSDDDINRRIASLSLFEGTAKEVGGTAIGAVELSDLPDLAASTTANDLSKVSHYWTFIGSPNTVVTATTPRIGTDLQGAVLNPGDWLQVANRGTVTAPDLHWVTVGGDLLAKARAERLFGLSPWAAGGWEQGSLVVHGESMYRATQPVTATDPAPDASAPTPNPWAKIPVSGGTKVAPDDSSLPLSAPSDEIWLVLSSSKAGGVPGLFTFDTATGLWMQLGGRGGAPIDMSNADELLSVGVPIGSIVAYAAATPPKDWIICDGRTIPAQYKQLIALIGTKTPDLTRQFVRGGTPEKDFPSHQWSTGYPRKGLSASQNGKHRHTDGAPTLSEWAAYGHAPSSVTGASSGVSGGRYLPYTSDAGEHTHTISGGDAETAPDHVVLLYIIKAADRTTIRRIS